MSSGFFKKLKCQPPFSSIFNGLKSFLKKPCFLGFIFLSHWGDFKYFFMQTLEPNQYGSVTLNKLNL